jgi:hypothetical protein
MLKAFEAGSMEKVLLARLLEIKISAKKTVPAESCKRTVPDAACQ